MKWFQIEFDQNEMIALVDAVFVKQFISFSHSIKHPAKLGLYSLKFRKDLGTAYYVSIPQSKANQLKEALIKYNISEVPKPNLKLLNLEFGKTVSE